MPISSMEILAWATLARLVPEEWELDAIRQLDGVFLKVMGEKED